MTRDWRTVKLERTENSRRFKEELIRDESRLASLNITEPNENWIYLDGINVLKDDYRQIKREIIEKIIKQNPQEWEIKKICVFDGDYCSRACGPAKFGWGYKEREVSLLHQDFAEKYDNQGEIIIRDENSGKIHYKDAFTADEWKEIASFLEKKDIKNVDGRAGCSSNNNLSSESFTKKPQGNNGKNYLIIGSICVLGLILLVIIKKSKLTLY